MLNLLGYVIVTCRTVDRSDPYIERIHIERITAVGTPFESLLGATDECVPLTTLTATEFKFFK